MRALLTRRIGILIFTAFLLAIIGIYLSALNLDVETPVKDVTMDGTTLDKAAAAVSGKWSGAPGSCTALDPEFVSNGSEFINDLPGGSSAAVTTISADEANHMSGPWFQGISFTNGHLSAVNLDVETPVKDVTMDGTTLDKAAGEVSGKWTGMPVHIATLSSSAPAYGNVWVKNCTFTLTNPDVSPVTIEYFYWNRESSDKVVVEGNSISTNQTTTSSGIRTTGIDFYGTNGQILSNTIDGNGGGLQEGIRVEGLDDQQQCTSFLCSNTIASCGLSGIISRYWKGFGRLDEVSASGIGHLFEIAKVNPPYAHLNYSSYSGCSGPGIEVNSSQGQTVLLDKLSTVEYDDAGYNTIANNNTSASSTSGELVFLGAGGHNLTLGSTVSSSTDEHHNNVIANASADLYAYCPSTITQSSLGALTDNFFSTDGVHQDPLASSGSEAMVNNISYTNETAAGSSKYTFSGVECGNGHLANKIVMANPLSDTVSVEECQRLANAVDYYGGSQFPGAGQMTYDTMKRYIESCYAQPKAWRYFGYVGSAVPYIEPKNANIWHEARQWLLSVLFLNPDSNFYCADLDEYAGTYAHRNDSGFVDYRTTLAIVKYISDSSHCKVYGNFLPDEWKTLRLIWKDTVTDSLKTPFDSTLPSLDQIGQTFLRGFKADVAVGPDGSEKALRSLRADRNPFGGDAELTYVTSLPCVAKMEVYDALGRQFWSHGQGYLDAGEHHLKIPTTGWSPGTYYARLTTIRGEVLTTKLVFEK